MYIHGSNTFTHLHILTLHLSFLLFFSSCFTQSEILSWWFGIRWLCWGHHHRNTKAKLQFTREVVKLDVEQLYTKRVSWDLHMRLISETPWNTVKRASNPRVRVHTSASSQKMLSKWQPRDGQRLAILFLTLTGIMSCTASNSKSPTILRVLLIIFLIGTFRGCTPMTRQVTQRIMHPGVQGCRLCSIAGSFEWLPGVFASDPCVEATLNYIHKQKEYERTQHITTHPLFHAKHDHRHFKFAMFQNSTIYDLYTFWKPNLGAITETKTPFPGLHMRAFWESHQAIKPQRHRTHTHTHTYVLVLKLVLHSSQIEDLKKKTCGCSKLMRSSHLEAIAA